ncbi:MAG: hypothetical protein JSS10_09470 [Verrucomicrobia bacterium]|nr:hypothetical protein [Verrucomicrobiota bacterium]
MGSVRTWTCAAELIASIREGKVPQTLYHAAQTTLAAVSLAGTIFAHPVGIVITTGQDLVIEASNLIAHLQANEVQKALESCAKIINNSLYLALMLRGGIELTIASMAFQIMLSLYQSQAEFRKGRYIEGSSHFLLACIRGNQLNLQIKMLHKSKLGQENYNEMIQRATEQEKAELVKKLEGFPEKNRYLQQLLQALKEGNWDSDIFANADYPYYALEALRHGILSKGEFATVQIFWEINQAHDKKSFQFLPFFNEDGSPSSDIKDLMREILRPKNEEDPLLDSKIDHLFEKIKSSSKSQQGIWLISDEIPSEDILFSKLPLKESCICRRLCVEVVENPKIQNKFFPSQFVKSVPSYDLMQAYLDVFYGRWAVQLNPILGFSTDNDTYQNSVNGRRNISLHHPAVSLPHRADGLAAPWYEFSCFHDFAFHATICSSLPQELAKAVAQIPRQISPPDVRLEELQVFWEDLDIPETFLRMKEGFSINDSFWVRIASSFDLVIKKDDFSFREKILKQVIDQFATQPLLQEGPRQALVACTQKRDSIIQDLPITAQENRDLYMASTEGTLDVLKMMVEIWDKSHSLRKSFIKI